MANHVYWVSGARGVGRGDRIPAYGVTVPTIFDRLQAAGVSWKFYVQNYDSHVTYRHQGRGNHIAQTIYVPILNFPRFIDNSGLFSHIVALSQYYYDLDHGTLPAVAYIAPSGDSEHPPSNIASGERFVHVLLGALIRSSAWGTSAFMLSYADWGGWYDHVRPPHVDAYSYGFRSPALLISPYARRGFVDHTVVDFSSQIKFIEQNWGLKPLAKRDAAASGLVSAFDFSKAARQPVLLGFKRHSPPPVHPRRGVVYLPYGGAIGVFAAAVGVAAARRRWPFLNGRNASSRGLQS